MDKDTLAMAEIINIHQEIELYGMNWYDPTCYTTEILDAKYEKVSTDYWRNSVSVLVLILMLMSTGRGCQIHLASKIPFYLL